MGEIHTPEIVRNDIDVSVNVYSHPMTEEHHIQFIEAYTPDKKYLYLKFLEANDEPVFKLSDIPKDIQAIEFCNIHGLWGSK